MFLQQQEPATHFEVHPGTKRKRGANEDPLASYHASPDSANAPAYCPISRAKPSALQRANSSPPALQSPGLLRSPDQDDDLLVTLSFARRTASAMPSASHKTATAAADLSLHTTAPAYNPTASAHDSGFPRGSAAGLAGNLSQSHTLSQNMPSAASADVDEQIYDVPESRTGTKAKGRYGQASQEGVYPYQVRHLMLRPDYMGTDAECIMLKMHCWWQDNSQYAPATGPARRQK